MYVYTYVYVFFVSIYKVFNFNCLGQLKRNIQYICINTHIHTHIHTKYPITFLIIFFDQFVIFFNKIEES